MGIRIKSLDIEIPYWIFFLGLYFIILIIFPYAVGPNCHGFCNEELARTIMGTSILLLIVSIVITAVTIGIIQGILVIYAIKGRPIKTSLNYIPPEKIDAIMGIAASTVGITGILLMLAIRISYGFSILGMIITGIGPLIFLTIGFFFLRYRIKRINRKNKLSKIGKYITAEVISVEMDTRWSQNNIHPYQIIAVGIHPKTKQKAMFYSNHIWINPQKFVPDQVRVLIDPDDPDNYKMDLSFLKKAKDFNWDVLITDKFRTKE